MCLSVFNLPMAFAVFLLGMVAGTSLGSPLADRYGRVRLLWISSVLSIPLTVLLISCESLNVLALVLLAYGLCVGPLYPLSLTYLSEIVYKDGIPFTCAVYQLWIPLSILLSLGLYWVIGNIVLVAIILSLCTACCVPFIYRLYESPKYLLAKRAFSEAKVSINAISVFNTNMNCELAFEQQQNVKDNCTGTGEEQELVTFVYHFRPLFTASNSRAFMATFAGLVFCTCFTCSGTWMQTFFSGKLPLYQRVYLWLMAVIAIGLYACICNRERHKKLLFLVQILTTFTGFVNLLLFGHPNDSFWYCSCAVTVLAFVAALGSIALATECCPYCVRATGLSLTVAAGTVGLTLGITFTSSPQYIPLWTCLASFLGLIVLQRVKPPDWYLGEAPGYASSSLGKYPGTSLEYSATQEMKEGSLRGSVVHNVSVLEGNEELLKEGDICTPTKQGRSSLQQTSRTQSALNFWAEFAVTGFYTVQGSALDLGLNSIRVAADDTLFSEGTHEAGAYQLTGRIDSKVLWRFSLDYGNGRTSEYLGKREGTVLSGEWKEGEEAGCFTLEFMLQEWEGWLRRGNERHEVHWLLGKYEAAIAGLGDEHSLKALLHGDLDDQGNVHFSLPDERGNIPPSVVALVCATCHILCMDFDRLCFSISDYFIHIIPKYREHKCRVEVIHSGHEENRIRKESKREER